MKWTVGNRIAGGYGLALAIVVIFGAVSYHNIAGLLDVIRVRVHTQEVLLDLEELQSGLENAETGQRGYVITGEEPYLAPYQTGTTQINTALENLRKLVTENPDQEQRLAVIEPLVTSKLNELNDTIELRRNKGFGAALQMIQTGQGKKTMDDIRKVAAQMTSEETQLGEKRNAEVQSNTRTTIAIFVYGIPLTFLLLIVGGFGVTRSITQQLRETIAQLSASAAEILATTTQVASGAAETASAVSETTVTVEEVKQTAQVASQKAKYVSDGAQKVAQISQGGRKSVEESIQGMRHIQDQMGSIAESVVRLSEQSQAIGEIIATVNDLTEQSNLLAVNAAIEAARAGEQGKGFSVVAQEVKSLADQSRQATAQVRTILGDIQKATTAAVMATEQGSKAVDVGVKQSTQAGESIRILAESVTESAQAATQIAASSQQQMVGMDQMALAMENIKQATAQNVSGTKQAEVAAQQLHDLGQKLSAMIGRKVA